MFEQDEFNRFVLGNSVIGFSADGYVFSSGRTCNCYVNWRHVFSDTYLLESCADYVLEFCGSNRIEPDSFYGIPESCTPLGVVMQMKWANQSEDYQKGSHLMSVGRARQKNHGDKREMEFVSVPRGRITIIEDTTTTGDSLIYRIREAQTARAEVIASIVLTDRNEKRDDGKTARQAVEEIGVPYYAMSSLSDMLPHAAQLLKPEECILSSVKDYFEEYGAVPIEWNNDRTPKKSMRSTGSR